MTPSPDVRHARNFTGGRPTAPPRPPAPHTAAVPPPAPPPAPPIEPPPFEPARPIEPAPRQRAHVDTRPVEFWPTSSIRAALETDDLTVWQRIVTAVKRDPYGRTARQVEEVLESARPYGVSKALAEVLTRSRTHLEANECAEVARHIRTLLSRSGLGQQEFASRIGLPAKEFDEYLRGLSSPPASLMVRMRRLSDRFAKMHAEGRG